MYKFITFRCKFITSICKKHNKLYTKACKKCQKPPISTGKTLRVLFVRFTLPYFLQKIGSLAKPCVSIIQKPSKPFHCSQSLSRLSTAFHALKSMKAKTTILAESKKTSCAQQSRMHLGIAQASSALLSVFTVFA